MRTPILLVLPLLVACWSSNTKELERKVDQLTAELSTSRTEVAALRRKVAVLLEDRDRLADREAERRARLDAIAAAPSPLPPPPPPPYRPRHDPQKVYAVPLGAAHVDGPADAKVTMVMAGEYGCPYCEKVRPTLAELRKRYGRDLRIAYRQFVVHPRTATAPALAICAAIRQRKHHRLDPLLWDKGFLARQFDTPTALPDGSEQSCWEHPDGCPIVLAFAKEAGLNVARFQADMAGACVTELADATRELTALGVSATPSFFINGRYFSGAQPIASFAALIDEELKKADERIQRGTRRARYYQEWVLDRGETTLGP